MGKRGIIAGLLVFLAFGLAGFSEPGPAVVQKMAHKLAGTDITRVEATRTLFDDKGQPLTAEPVTLTLGHPASVQLARGGQALPLTPGEQALFAFLLKANQAGTAADAMKAWGVDLTQKTLGRQEGRTCVVLGAESSDGKAAQVWIDKFAYTLARAAFTLNENGGHRYEARLNEWGNPVTRGLFPRTLEITRDGAPLVRYDVSGAEKK